MKPGSLDRTSLKVCVLFAFAAVVSTNAAIALPRRGGVGCTCTCEAPGQGGLIISTQTYRAPSGTDCSTFSYKACNVEDPSTGGIRSGHLAACGDERQSTTFVWSQSPFGGGLTIYRGGISAPK
jgi:hypothetical protein